MKTPIENFLEKYDIIADSFAFLSGSAWNLGFISQDRRNLPNLAMENVFVYGIRHSDVDDSVPVSLEKSVLVNRYGWFITLENLDWFFKERDFLPIEDWDYTED